VFNNPLRLFALAAMTATVIGLEFAIAYFMIGISAPALLLLIAAQTILTCIIVAILDPTYNDLVDRYSMGYYYFGAVCALIVAVEICFRNRLLAINGALLAVACWASMAATYRIRRELLQQKLKNRLI
jgi:hypothetical protein